MGLIVWGVILLLAGGAGYIVLGAILSDPMANNSFVLTFNQQFAQQVTLFRTLQSLSLGVAIVGLALLVVGLIRRPGTSAQIVTQAPSQPVINPSPKNPASQKPEQKFCVKCGAQNDMENMFCGSCGATQPELV